MISMLSAYCERHFQNVKSDLNEHLVWYANDTREANFVFLLSVVVKLDGTN